jgi:transglutaminase-like putative cysteine protease
MNSNAAVRLAVTHHTQYSYAAPVSLAHHLAYLQPLQDLHQQLLTFEMTVLPAPQHSRDGRDSWGNTTRHFSLHLAHQQLQVQARSQLQVLPRFLALQAQASPPWDALARSLRGVAQAPLQEAVEFVQPSPYVPRMEALRAWLGPLFTPGRPVADAALALMQQLHGEFSYVAHSTAVDTPLAQVWAQKRGVCQDFAHLMIAALRLLGLPARYVSGYLLTHAADGAPALVGADASHAWLQLWCPGTPGVPSEGAHAGWLDLDPTNNLVPAASHVRLAVGRDYGDVTPLRGVIRGSGAHTLSVAVSTHALHN